ncbi:MAG TPA: hypothetical protein VF313_09180 [Anaerolineaceae bacterium]
MAKEKNYPTKYGRSKPKSSRKPLILMIVGAVVLIIALIFVFLQPQPTTGTPGGTPKLKADKELVDLGDQTLGTPVKVTFQLSNIGGSTVQFTKEPYVEAREGC